MPHAPHHATGIRNAIVAVIMLVIGSVWTAHMFATFPGLLASWKPLVSSSAELAQTSIATVSSFSEELKKSQTPTASADILTPEQVARVQDAIVQAQPVVAGLPETPVAETPAPVVTDAVVTACTRGGGMVSARTSAKNRAYRVCIFFDGSECEAKAFSEGVCHRGQYTRAEQDPHVSL